MTDMRPVVVDPQISFTQLVRELTYLTGDAEQAQVRDQFIAKLQRKKQHLSEAAARDFERVAGVPPNEFIAALQTMSLDEIADWFAHNPDLGEILDRLGEGQRPLLFISDHADQLYSVNTGTAPQSSQKIISRSSPPTSTATATRSRR